MQLTNFTDYGLRCLMYLAVHQNRLSTIKEISEYFGISHNHLVKVVHKLSQLKLIESSKGKGGGIKIALNAEHLRLGDIVKMLESNMNLVECFDKDTNRCNITNICQLKHIIQEAKLSFIDVLNKYTLSDTVKNLKFITLPKQPKI